MEKNFTSLERLRYEYNDIDDNHTKLYSCQLDVDVTRMLVPWMARPESAAVPNPAAWNQHISLNNLQLGTTTPDSSELAT